MSDASPEKRRIRVAARTSYTNDSFQNFAQQLGIGTNNTLSAGTYGFNPISRNRTLLDWAYRGNWVAGMAVDAVAEDMTRAGIQIQSGMTTSEIQTMQQAFKLLDIWGKLCDAIKWGRLYGGGVAVILMEGQSPETPLRPEFTGRNQFKGLYVYDRWTLWPTMNDLVTELGPDLGTPKYYVPMMNMPVYPNKNIHHTRCIRLDGIDMPYWQKQTENWWSISVLERLYDRLIAFDSTTLGAAQLVSKAHLRTLSVEQLRELIAAGGDGLAAVKAQVDFIRLFQSNEGITLLDASDKFEAHQYAFSGLGDMLLQFAQQVAGALQIPLVRMFGQAPAGMNATGESDFRNYYDGINTKQESRLRRPVQTLLELLSWSKLGKPLPENLTWMFTPLWQMSALERADLGNRNTDSVVRAYEAGIVSRPTALEELRAGSEASSIWTNITDEEIEEAELAPPPAVGAAVGGQEQPSSPLSAPVQPDTPHASSPPGASVEAAAPYDPDKMSADDTTMPEDMHTGEEPGKDTVVDIFLPGRGQVDIHAQKPH